MTTSNNENDNETNEKSVVSIKKKRASKAQSKTVNKADLFHAIYMAIERNEFALLPDFPVRFYVTEPSPGVRRVLLSDDEGIVRYVDAETVTNAILSYTVTELSDRQAYKWTVQTCKEAMQYWRALSKPIPEPPAVLWPEQEGLCFHRLPWAYKPDFSGEATPLFNEMFSRLSNAQALMDWIGSLFDPSADRQQYVWIFGQGGNGKGALARFLSKAFGGAASWENPPSFGDKFWTSGLINKRLVIFGDCNDAKFPSSGLFKSLSGGDQVRIEEKGRASYTTTLTAKFLFLSNEKPELSSEAADLRRAIYCEMKPIQGAGFADYESRLWQEGGAFLSTCIHNYSKTYPERGAIKANMTEIEGWVAAVEEPFEVFFEEHFTLTEGAFVLPKEMQARLKSAGWGFGPKMRDFHRWLERTHGVTRKQIRLSDGRREWRYQGMRANFFGSQSDPF